MKTRVSSALIVAAVATAWRLLGAETPTKTVSLGVTVADVVETRMLGAMGVLPGDCRVFLTLTGDAAADAHSVREIRVTTATDEVGRNLVKRGEAAPQSTEASIRSSPAEEQKRLDAVAAEVSRRRMLREGATAGMPLATQLVSTLPPSSYRSSRPVIALRNPSRQSSSIKLIEGEIDLFTPTEANGGLVRLPDITKQPGELVKYDARGSTDIQLVYFTQGAFEAKGDLVGTEARPLFNSAFKLYGREAACISIRDPKRLVVELELQTADGKQIKTEPFYGGSVEWNRSLFMKTPPPADTQLMLHIAVSGAIKTYPFKLENIPLP